MAYNAKQISTLMNDVIEDLSGQNAALSAATTSDLVSLGKAIENANLYEGFFGSLCNRLAKTVYFIRVYDPDNARAILRDEHEYGAFVQKVYFAAPDIVDNPEYGIPQYTEGSISGYKQSSPYDVEATVAVSAKIFDKQGTFALEIVRPIDQIRNAFLSESEMMRFIDGIYLAVENKMKMAEEALVSTAVATAIAYDIENGMVYNVLTAYNTLYEDVLDTPLTADLAWTDADFLRFASMELKNLIYNMRTMSQNYNSGKYLTFTDSDNLVVEMLSRAANAFDTYLASDTFHNELVALPKFERINRWQYSPQDIEQGMDDISKISITHEALSGTGGNHTVTQSGIFAFVHDIEHVAAYFGHRRSWEKYNERQDLMIHGETARKGYAVDPNANGVVLIVADPVT